MRSTVAAICLLFVAGFLQADVERAVEGSVRAASVSARAPEARQAERARRAVAVSPAIGWPLAVRSPRAPAKALRVTLGGLPAPRAPDAAR